MTTTSPAKGYRSHITDQAVVALKAKTGQEFSHRWEDWELDGLRFTVTEIKRMCIAIGDTNPIFFDPEYGRQGPFGRNLVPSGLLVEQEQINFGPDRQGFPGCRPVLDSVEIIWRRRLMQGDALQSRTRLLGLEDLGGGVDGRVVVLRLHTDIADEKGEPIATTQTSYRCYERGTETERRVFGGRVPYQWVKEQMDATHEEYRREYANQLVRGANGPKFDEVRIAEDLPYVLKGPTTTVRRVTMAPGGSWGAGIGWWYYGLEEQWQQIDRSPELFFINEHGAPEPIEAAGWMHWRAQGLLGLPGALEENSERVHWTIQFLTNWMGDEGFLRRLSLSFPKVNIVGDLTRCYGRVRARRKEGTQPIVEIDVWNINQVGDTVTAGTAEVALAS